MAKKAKKIVEEGDEAQQERIREYESRNAALKARKEREMAAVK